jgi:hypothetical protein
MKICVCDNCSLGGTVKGLWALWRNYECAVIVVAMVMFLRNFGPYRIIFMTARVCVCVCTALDFLVIFDRQLTRSFIFFDKDLNRFFLKRKWTWRDGTRRIEA